MRLQVTFPAEGLCGIALGAIRGHLGEECFSPEGHGVVDVGDGIFSTSLASAIGSLQGRHSRGKTAPTLPIHRIDRLQVHRPVSVIREFPD